MGIAKRRSMIRNLKHDDDDDASSSSKKRPQTCAQWSDLDHDLLCLVLMQLGVADYYSFRRVCKSWRSIARSIENKFMASRPPVSITSIYCHAYEKTCYVEDFEGRQFKTVLPLSAAATYVGSTCGYLIFFTKKTHDFWLMNPITREELLFPAFPFHYYPGLLADNAILVFSRSISGWVFVVLRRGEIWFSIAGKGAWKYVLYTFDIGDIFAFKGKIYTLTNNDRHPIHESHRLCELRLGSEPKITLLEIKNPSEIFYPKFFVRSCDTFYMMARIPHGRFSLHELDFGEMKWVPCETTMEEYAFFHSGINNVHVAVKRESWADPRSRSHGIRALSPATAHNGNEKIPFIFANMWYFPHECMDIDCID